VETATKKKAAKKSAED